MVLDMDGLPVEVTGHPPSAHSAFSRLQITICLSWVPSSNALAILLSRTEARDCTPQITFQTRRAAVLGRPMETSPENRHVPLVRSIEPPIFNHLDRFRPVLWENSCRNRGGLHQVPVYLSGQSRQQENITVTIKSCICKLLQLGVCAILFGNLSAADPRVEALAKEVRAKGWIIFSAASERATGTFT